jgi:fimbrial chaperone protein
VLRRRLRQLAAGAASLSWAAAVSAGFDAMVSPPRFELQAKPGEVVRQVLGVTNGSREVASFTVKTAEWRLDDSGGVAYTEGKPAANSCRRWVKIERYVIKVAPRQTRNYRFEVHVPPGTTGRECRFALLVASEAARVTPTGSSQIQIPLIGRIGVIVYVAVADAKPKLELRRLGLRTIGGTTTPVATFRNSGDAHGRVLGALDARDAKGRTVELVAEQAVILPGAERTIRLQPFDYSSGEPKRPDFDLVAPIHVRGRLEFQGGGEVKINQVLR